MKDLLKDVSVSSILTALIGLVLLVMPKLTNKIIVYGIGIVLLVYGAGRILRYIGRDAGRAMMDYDLSVGLVCAVMGLFMLLYSKVVIGILPFVFGLFLIFGGARSIQTAFDIKRFRGSNWSVHLIVGIAFVIVGVIAIRDPFSAAATLTRFVGLSMLVQGIYMFIAGRMVRELREQFMSDF